MSVTQRNKIQYYEITDKPISMNKVLKDDRYLDNLLAF